MRWATVAVACTGESRLPGHRQRADADADAHAARCSCWTSKAKQGRQMGEWRR